MGKADKITKDYVSDTDVFADAFNYLFYNGRSVVEAEKLNPVDTASLLKLFGDENSRQDSEWVQRYRDILKRAIICKDEKVTYVLLGIEGQTSIHYAMPVRDMLYDSLQYAEQVNQFQAIHQSKKDDTSSDEFLSGMHAEDKLIPVVTLVIYFGSKPWNAAKKLSDMMIETNAEIARYVQDYELTIIEPYSMNDEDFDKFTTDLGEVLKFLKYAENKTELGRLLDSDKSFRNMKRKAAEVLKECAKLEVQIEPDVEVVDMCKAWEDQRLAGKAEGIREGIREEKNEMILNMYEAKLGIEQIAQIARVSIEYVKRIVDDAILV